MSRKYLENLHCTNKNEKEDETHVTMTGAPEVF